MWRREGVKEARERKEAGEGKEAGTSGLDTQSHVGRITGGCWQLPTMYFECGSPDGCG